MRRAPCPFVSKATGRPHMAKIAARCMAGQTLKAQGIVGEVAAVFSVKEAVFPFNKFPGVDTILGPEMKSTGEVMGVGYSFAEAFESRSWRVPRFRLRAGVPLGKERRQPKVAKSRASCTRWASRWWRQRHQRAITAAGVPVETVKSAGRPPEYRRYDGMARSRW